MKRFLASMVMVAVLGVAGCQSGPTISDTATNEPDLYYNPHSLRCSSIRAQAEGYC